MKKYLFGVSALALAVVFSSFTLLAPVTFFFTPANELEADFENSTKWVVASSDPSCTGGSDVCIIRIDDSKLAPYSGTQTQKLAAYMLAQGVSSFDYANATAAANALAISQKP